MASWSRWAGNPWWVTRRCAGRGRGRKPRRTQRGQRGCQRCGWFVGIGSGPCLRLCLSVSRSAVTHVGWPTSAVASTKVRSHSFFFPLHPNHHDFTLFHIITSFYLIFIPPLTRVSDFATSQKSSAFLGASRQPGFRALRRAEAEGKLYMWELADRPSHSESGVNLDLSGTLIWLIRSLARHRRVTSGKCHRQESAVSPIKEVGSMDDVRDH